MVVVVVVMAIVVIGLYDSLSSCIGFHSCLRLADCHSFLSFLP